ncbi:MAG: hypothetical protein NZ659_10570, partial [Acidimicrobiales bacterium]|nr:hypothetical protein [Acidimicrobiales bacterium]
MAFDFKNPYAPPGVYTESEFATDLKGNLTSTNIPMLIGPGNEILTRSNLEVVRGSSQTVDQRVPQDDMAGRAVDDDGNLAEYDGVLTVFKVRNFPIVAGDGNGRTTNAPSNVTAFLNGEPTVILSVNGAEGLVELAVAPAAEDDEITITYFFNRMDTEQTDDLSAQITSGASEIISSVDGAGGYVIEAELDTNDTFFAEVDGESLAFRIPGGTWTAAQMMGFLNSVAVGSLEVTTATSNEGGTVLVLTADQGITIGDGLANETLGFVAGDTTTRNTVFYVHQRPIVDGTNAGRTLSAGDSTGVSVTVDGEAVAVSDVDGKNGAITLADAPADGASIEVTYYWNSWQNTFDYVFDIGVTRVLACGKESGRMDYLNGTDFVLKDDRIYWGTSAIIEADATSEEAAAFDDTQITAQLADVRTHMESCSAVTSGGSTSRTAFTLQRVPTSGNGTGSPGNEYPLSSATFSSMINARRDVWSNRPELVKVWVGYNVSDALVRGEATVASVSAGTKTVTLTEPIEPGMSVFATYWYNRIDDETFTLTCESAGASGAGTYSITDSGGDSVVAATLTDKGDGLVEILQWESGNSNFPFARFEPVSSDLFTGAVAEVVTVTLVDKDETPATISFGNPGPYYFIGGESDTLHLDVDSAGTSTANDLSCQAAAMLISDEVSYDPTNDNTSWAIESGMNDTVSLSVDGQTINATVAAGDQSIEAFVTAINAAAMDLPPQYTAACPIKNTVLIGDGPDVQNTIEFDWDDSSGAAAGPVTATIASASYADIATLAAAVELAIQTAIDGAVAADDRPRVVVEGNNSSQLVFTFLASPNTLITPTPWAAFAFLDTAG